MENLPPFGYAGALVLEAAVVCTTAGGGGGRWQISASMRGWAAKRLDKIRNRAVRNRVPDHVTLEALHEQIEVITATAGLLQEALTRLNGGEDDAGEGVVYA